ncbi:hypothetical protein BBF96_13870 [Anoxybacter fermentans]|uniref:ABC transporter permease n=1 Tax=Anoxybacter fermentans TaxID=1323375 RepID=A0A3Q9HU36_9FIRM|nr:ABC-2 family transporter protein [Anoxybacter fermentans]AZR74378.1 hypothetical protein BBF96_13870 [Anoxybacter fermentans]
MNAYIKHYLISVQDKLNYRIDFLFKFFTIFLHLYASVTIWYAIATANSSSLDETMIADIIKYMILASITTNLMIFCTPEREIARRIRTGEIARDLIYPISLPITLIFKGLGFATANLISMYIPGFILLSIIYKPAWNLNLINIAGLLIGILLGYFIFVLITLQIEMISFWWIENWYMHYIKHAVFNFLSGTLVPLWFYPEWLYKILNWLPFKNIVYIPLGFYLNRISLEQFCIQMALSIFWIILLAGVTFVIWKAGVKKVVIQGG